MDPAVLCLAEPLRTKTQSLDLAAADKLTRHFEVLGPVQRWQIALKPARTRPKIKGPSVPCCLPLPAAACRPELHPDQCRESTP